MANVANALGRGLRSIEWIASLETATALVTVAVIAVGLGDSGVWDPVELRGAEQARDAGDLGGASIALGFRLFGESAAAGRSLLAAWALVGLVALYVFLRACVDARAALYGAVTLATMPLYFVHARTMLGDIVMMSTNAVAFAGLAIAVLSARRGAFVVGLLGLGLGCATRGALVGSIPALGVGLAWALAPRGRVGAVTLGLGLVAAALGAWSLFGGGPAFASLGLHRLGAPPPRLSFDAILAQLGHALFPWSALVPFAAFRVFAPAPPGEGDARRALLAVVSVALVVHAVVAERAAGMPFAAPASIAAIAAVALRDLDRGPRAPVAGVGMGCLGAVLVNDFVALPEKGLAAFVAEGTAFPESFRGAARAFVLVAGALVAVASAVCLVPGARDSRSPGSSRASPTWRRASVADALARVLARIADSVASATRARGALVLALTMLAALVLRFGYFRTLGEHVAPKGIFEAYARLRRPDEPLALLGVSAAATRLTGAGPARSFDDVARADAWLAEGGRRFLALRGSDLPPMNALFRRRTSPPRNLPIASGASSELLLAASTVDGFVSENPLDAVLPMARPTPSHPLLARFGDALGVLGWDVVDAKGAPTAAARRGDRLRVYYDVRAPVPAGYCTFVHVDHTPSRFSAEHRAHRYPMALWREGDIVVDEFALALPGHFHAGGYALYVGVGALPCTDDRRMPVTRGKSDGRDRLVAGTLTVAP